MIQGHQVFKLPDLSGRPKFKVEVNWNPDNKKTNECKVLKITYEGKERGETFYMKKEHLLGMLFMIGSVEEQQKMIPTQITRVRHWKSNLFLKMTRDVKRDEILKVPVDITLPAVSEEIIGDLRKDILKGNLKTEKDMSISKVV